MIELTQEEADELLEKSYEVFGGVVLEGAQRAVASAAIVGVVELLQKCGYRVERPPTVAGVLGDVIPISRKPVPSRK